MAENEKTQYQHEDVTDETTKDILEDIAKENGENTPAEEVKEVKETPKEEVPKTEETKPKTEEAEPKVDDKKETEGDGEKTEDDEVKVVDRKNPSSFLPVSKHTEVTGKLKDKLVVKDEEIATQTQRIKDLETELADAKPAEVDAKIKAYAEKNDVKPETVSELVAIISEKVGGRVPDDVKVELAEVKEERNSKKQDDMFAEEFTNLTKEFTDEESEKLGLKKLSEVKEKLKELAFTENLATTPLRYILLGTKEFKLDKPDPKKKTIEGSRGGSENSADVVDFTAIEHDAEAIKNLSKEQFDKFDEWLLAKSNKTLFIRKS